MRAGPKHSEIFGAIVEGVFVDVVNLFASPQGATEFGLHDPAMDMAVATIGHVFDAINL
jgi:hypothetical protein